MDPDPEGPKNIRIRSRIRIQQLIWVRIQIQQLISVQIRIYLLIDLCADSDPSIDLFADSDPSVSVRISDPDGQTVPGIHTASVLGSWICRYRTIPVPYLLWLQYKQYRRFCRYYYRIRLLISRWKFCNFARTYKCNTLVFPCHRI